jgi:hypothetical protein
MLDDTVAETSIEGTGREASVDAQPRHATRSTRNGRADVNYSQKYHPMDEVTRPKRAQRITGSRPRSSFAETSDEEEPELSSGESTDADEPSEASGDRATRTPDPGAVRHSSRTAAQKQVNYSIAHHPQDWAISGYRQLAKRKRRSDSAAKPQKRSRKATSHGSQIILSSGKTSDSESDDDDSPADHPPADTASMPSRDQGDSSDTHRADSDGPDAQLTGSDRVPPLPRDESSYNVADAIVQGKLISRMHAAIERSDTEESANDSAATDFTNASTKEIGDEMSAILKSVATPVFANSEKLGTDHTTPGELVLVPPSASMPTALVTPASMGVSHKSYTPAKTQGAISRPYIATQLKPSSNGDRVHKPDQAEPFVEPSLKTSTASAQFTPRSDSSEESSKSEDTSLEEEHHDTFSDASRQAMRDASEDAARTARAMEITNQLFPSALSQRQQSHPTSRNGDASGVSRQVSRDTLPDDNPSSYFFDEAMAGTQSHSQRDHDNDPQKSFTYGHSQLPVSERERSDFTASQAQPSSDSQVADGNDHHPLTAAPNTGQPMGGHQVFQQQS